MVNTDTGFSKSKRITKEYVTSVRSRIPAINDIYKFNEFYLVNLNKWHISIIMEKSMFLKGLL